MSRITIGVVPAEAPEPYTIVVARGGSEPVPGQCDCGEAEEPRWKFYDQLQLLGPLIWNCRTCGRTREGVRLAEYFDIETPLMPSEDEAVEVILSKSDDFSLIYVDVEGHGEAILEPFRSGWDQRNVVSVRFARGDRRIVSGEGHRRSVELGYAALSTRLRLLLRNRRLRLPAEGGEELQEALRGWRRVIGGGGPANPLARALGLAVQHDMSGDAWEEDRDAAEGY